MKIKKEKHIFIAKLEELKSLKKRKHDLKWNIKVINWKQKKNERKVYLNYKTEKTKWSERKKED